MRKMMVLSAAALLGTTALEAQSWRTVTISRQLTDQGPMRVSVNYGAGRLNVRSTNEGLLYRMQLRYDEELFEPVAELDGDRLRLGVESERRGIHIGRRRQGGELELALAEGVPMSLNLEFGAVRADVDLGGLALTDLSLSTGASEATIDVSRPNTESMDRASFQVGAADFSARHLGNLNAERIDVDAGVGEVTLWFTGAWRRDARVQLDMGIGALELRFPEGLGVRLRKDSFLTSLDSQGLVKRGDEYYSLDWDDAERRVTVDLDAAFGSVKVVWVR